MDNAYPPEAWQRLGRRLQQRRGELGYGYRQRAQFLASRPGPVPSGKTVARLERGERHGYPPGTMRELEALYELPPGSFEVILDGGDPSPARPALSAVPSPPAAFEPGDLAAEVIDLLLSEDPDPQWWDLFRAVWRMDEEQQTRLTLLRQALQRRVPEAERPPPRQERARSATGDA